MRNNVHGGALREIRAPIALHTRSRARRAASLVETSQPEHALEGWFDPSSLRGSRTSLPSEMTDGVRQRVASGTCARQK